MDKLKLEFPDHFFEGEERCGYYISPEMKKVWAVLLDLLHELQIVCEQYGIRYYASGGTMLGAVRHQGMIPWDDDIDIFMKRKDYERFVKIARAGVFRNPYFWQDHITDPGYLGGPGRLQNINTTCIGIGGLNERHGTVNLHQGIYIDVFPLDNMPDIDFEREQWRNRISRVARQAWDLRMYTHRGLLQDRKDLEWLSFWLNLTGRPNYLFEEYYALLAENAEQETVWSCTWSFWCRDPRLRFMYKNEDFKEVIYMPFEFFQIPVPVNYDAILTKSYGDWHQYVKGTSCHEMQGNSFFDDVERPYTYYVDPVNGLKKELLRNVMTNQHQRTE